MVPIKLKTIFVFLILSTFFCTQIFSNCVDFLDAIDHKVKRNADCALVTDDLSELSKRAPEPKIIVTQFHCDNATQKICDNVKRTFEEAGKIISNTFILKQSINVQVTYTNLCKAEPGSCNLKGETIIIGGARSARNILMLDDDGIARYYPQPLVKQFQFQPHPEFAPIDIISSFNSIIDWYFSSQTTPIRPKQRDMLFIVLHEMMHGLGFFSQWSNWFDIGDPNRVLITTRPEVAPTDKDETIFNGFIEGAFDRFVRFNDKGNKRLTEISKDLNRFAKPGKIFKNDSDLIQNFLDSKQVKIAEFMNKITTTPKKLSSSCSKAAKVILETNVKPFQPGTSVSHVDEKIYANTPDFLMIRIPTPGKTLKEILKQVGGKNPIGPKLKSIMECIGWATKENPNPNRPRLA